MTNIEIFPDMWLKVETDNLEVIGLKKDQVIQRKDIRKIKDDNEIRKLILNDNLINITEEEAIELGGIVYKEANISELQAKDVNEFIELKCQIIGEQSQKALVKWNRYECPNCGGIYKIEYKPEDVIFSDKYKEPNKCSCGRKGKFKLIESEYSDYAVLFVRELLENTQKFLQTRYEPKKIYLVEKTLPITKIISIKGKVIIEPRTNNISVVANDIQPLKNQIEDFVITKEHKENWSKYFGEDKVELYKQINPDIVGSKRIIAKKSIIMQLHSPSRIYDIKRKKIMRGGIRIVNIGDTKTAKTDLARDVTTEGYYNIGSYISAETSGRTGIAYTIDNDNKTLIWGELPLNDLGLLVIDGVQSMPSDEMAQLLEVLELQKVIVRRSQKGEALARTRTTICLNPYKPMNEYIFKCQAITNTPVFRNTQAITRHDLFIPYCLRDVSSGEITKRDFEERPIPKDIFLSHIIWVWSRKPEQIIYTDSAIKEIKELSETLIDDYSIENLPIVHNGVRDILTRLGVAKACELHSTNESNEKIIVESKHIKLAFDFYVDCLDLLELGKYKGDIEGKSELTDNDIIEIAKDLGETEYTILNEIKHETKSSTQLAIILDLSTVSVKTHYEKLKKHNLIETKQGVGIGLTTKGIKFVRWGVQNDSKIVKENFTNEKDSKEKLTYLPSKTYTPPSISEEEIKEIDKDLPKYKAGKKIE